jgi:subtilisin family serine protease
MLEENASKTKYRLYSRRLLQLTTCSILGLLLLSTTIVVSTMPQKHSVLAQPSPLPLQGGVQAPPAQGGVAQQGTPPGGLNPSARPPPEALQGLASVPQQLERTVANLPRIPPPNAPIGDPIVGQYIVDLRAPSAATAANRQLAQQALSTFAQSAETLSAPLETAGLNVTALPNVGALVVRTNTSTGAGAAGLAAGTQQGGGAPSPQAQQMLQGLRANANVENVYQDREVNIQAQTLPTGINRIDADWTPRPGKAGDGQNAVNADIAIIDTGVQTNHPDLTVFRCVGFGFPTCNDGQGHGTHVAGTAAAKDNNIGVVGVAPGARIWAIKVLSDQGTGSFANILAGINYVIANRAAIESVNLSLGCHGTQAQPCTFPPVEDALKALALLGVPVAISAGNNGQPAQFNTPARAGIGFPGVMTVSAGGDSDGRCGGFGPIMNLGGGITVADDTYPTFSAFNNDNIAAPGAAILSTYRGNGYAVLSGTSMASPHIAGAAAYYKSLFPAMTPAQIEDALKTRMATDRPVSGNGLLSCDGNGRGYVRDDGHQHREPLLYMGLTGVYQNTNDGGLYYMRQDGPFTLYWAGLSQNGVGTAFTNVYRGTINPNSNPGTTIGAGSVPGTNPPIPAGVWCDVPRASTPGTAMNCGTLSIRMTSPYTFQRVADGGYLGSFSGANWIKLP